MTLAGSGSVGRCDSSRWRLIFAPAENCQRLRMSLADCRILQECQRAISAPNPVFGPGVFDERLEVLLGLSDAQDLLDGGAAGLHLVPAVDAQRAHTAFDGFLGHGRGG